ncbi:MAG: immunoglobulin domain-containing protein, partial [Limisphaerales bacterium]
MLSFLAAGFAASSASAQVVQYLAASHCNADGWVADSGFGTSGAHCLATGCDTTISTRFTTLGVPTNKFISITPTLLAGSNYTLEICVPTSAGNIATNLNVVWSFINADNGSGGTAILDTNAYSGQHYLNGATKTDNTWYMAGTFRATDVAVTLKATFDDKSTPVNSGVRWNEGAYRITLQGDCRAKVPQLTSIDGPLIAGQTNVAVLGVTNGATIVYVYANGVQIGTNSSFSLGTNLTGKVTVKTSPLNKGDVIQATQVYNPGSGCSAVEGYLLSSGPVVGGGANPVIRMCFEVGKNTGLTGPIGANAGGLGTPVYWMGASTRAQALTGASFVGGTTLNPDAGWQTVTYNNTDGPTYDYNDNSSGPIAGSYAVLSGVAFAMEDTTDSGPYQIYIDNIQNGSTVLFDAETNNTGTTPFFNTPSGSGSFGGYSTAGNVLPNPNLAVVVNTNSDTGTKSALISFQFAHNVFNTTWLHLSTKSFPEIDLSQPISMRVLVLPVGTTTNALNILSPAKLPNTTGQIGSTVTFTMVGATLGGTESSSVTYKWQLNGTDLTDYTTASGTIITGSGTSTLRFDNATTDVQGTITCVVRTTASGATSS